MITLPPNFEETIETFGLDDPALPERLRRHASPVLSYQAAQRAMTRHPPALARPSLQEPADRLVIGKPVGDERRGTILLEREAGPAARTADAVAKASDAPVDIITVGSATSHAPPRIDGDEAPGALIEDWRPGRSVGHVRGAAGTLGVLVEFEHGRGRSLRRVRGFTSASHVLSLVSKVEAGETVLSPGYPDAERDPATYGVGQLRRWCALVHYAAGNAIENDKDIAFVELDAAELPRLPERNRVPDPAAPDVREIELTRVADPADVNRLQRGASLYMVGRTSGYRAGVLHSAATNPIAINLPDRRTYLYANLHLVRPADPGLGFSADGDSGGPVYMADGALIGFVVGQAPGGTWIQLAAPCLAFAKARLLL